MMPSHLCLLLLNCFLGAASSARVTKGRTQEGSLPLSASQPLSDDPDQGMVFQHMSKLYEKYNRETRLREGNTVRSVRATPAFSDHRTAYQLNLTTLQDSEVVLSATFHFLHERRPPQKPWFCKRFRSPSCRAAAAAHPSISLLFHSISQGSEVRSRSPGSLLANVTFHPHRRGVWQMKDVTQVMKEAWDEGHRLVSVELDVGQHNKRTAEDGDLPYLLVYADDRALAEPNSVAASLQRYDPFGDEGEIAQSSQLLHRPVLSPESPERVRRAAALTSDLIQNNELPEVDYKPDGYRKDDPWESAWYVKLKPKSGRKEEKRKSQDEGEHNGDELQVLKGGGGRTSHEESTAKPFKDSRARTIGDGRKHERRSEGKDVKKHKSRSNAQSPVLSFDEQTMRNARRRQWSSSQHKGCSRRNLRVDFADIGWSEWVIAPKAFEAYYCAGTCGFPLPKVSRPSNHATIQSIVRAVGIIPGVPEPCCVPEKMSPLAVLYQDESRNPVLKIYPNMSIQSCSCR